MNKNIINIKDRLDLLDKKIEKINSKFTVIDTCIDKYMKEYNKNKAEFYKVEFNTNTFEKNPPNETFRYLYLKINDYGTFVRRDQFIEEPNLKAEMRKTILKSVNETKRINGDYTPYV